MKPVSLRLACLPLVFLILAMIGCDNAKVKALTEKAKAAAAKGTAAIQDQVEDKVGAASTEVQEQLQLAGKIELNVEAPIETKACYARFVVQPGSDRSTVFELRSYSAPNKEEFPSVFFHSQIKAATAAELSGQIVSGRLFVQPTADGPTWFSAIGSPVELQITSIKDNNLTAEIVKASLQNTQTGASVEATGSFDAVQQ